MTDHRRDKRKGVYKKVQFFFFLIIKLFPEHEHLTIVERLVCCRYNPDAIQQQHYDPICEGLMEPKIILIVPFLCLINSNSKKNPFSKLDLKFIAI